MKFIEKGLFALLLFIHIKAVIKLAAVVNGHGYEESILIWNAGIMSMNELNE